MFMVFIGYFSIFVIISFLVYFAMEVYKMSKEKEVDVIVEKHYILYVNFKSITKSEQPYAHNKYFKYDITIETGEILSTNLEGLELNKIYKMEIHGYKDENNGLYRYVSGVL